MLLLIAIVTSTNLAQTVTEREPRTSWAASLQVSNLSAPKLELTDGDGLINPARECRHFHSRLLEATVSVLVGAIPDATTVRITAELKEC